MKQLKMLSVVMLAVFFLFSSVSVPFAGAPTTTNAATITISSKALTLDIGTSKALRISGTKSRISWSSSNRSVATVSSYGTVTAKATGTATVTASVSGKKLSCKITAVKPITISNKTLTLQLGNTKKLTVAGTKNKVTWSSSNTKIAKVSTWGTITPVAAGKVSITAAVAGKKLTCSLTVTEPLKLSKNSYSLETGKTYKLIVTGNTNKVTWTSDNTSVATVSSYGTITAQSAGTAVITAKVDGKTLTCTVTVTEPVKISDNSYTFEVDEAHTLQISGSYNNIIWTSGDASIATVSSSGLVTAVAPGSTVITADVDGKLFTCDIIVNVPSPYVINAPFPAKEWKKPAYSIVTPKQWTAYFTDLSSETQTGTFVTFDAANGSYVNIGIYDTGEPAPEYAVAKETFLAELDETTLRQSFADVFTNMGITDYSITDFEQGDFVSDHGNVFKTEYTLNLMGSSTKQIMYYYFIDDKMVEVSATDMDLNLEAITDYIVNSLQVNQ